MKKYALLILGIIILIILIIVYKSYNPLDSSLFPKCPVKYATGLDCPGCGSQRAVHYMLNRDFENAIKSNLLAVLFIPYISLGFITNFFHDKSTVFQKIRKHLFGYKVIIAILVIITVYTILRNVL